MVKITIICRESSKENYVEFISLSFDGQNLIASKQIPETYSSASIRRMLYHYIDYLDLLDNVYNNNSRLTQIAKNFNLELNPLFLIKSPELKVVDLSLFKKIPLYFEIESPTLNKIMAANRIVAALEENGVIAEKSSWAEQFQLCIQCLQRNHFYGLHLTNFKVIVQGNITELLKYRPHNLENILTPSLTNNTIPAVD